MILKLFLMSENLIQIKLNRISVLLGKPIRYIFGYFHLTAALPEEIFVQKKQFMVGFYGCYEIFLVIWLMSANL